MTLDDLRSLCARIDYKPLWFLHTGNMGTGFVMQWRFEGYCHRTGRQMMMHCRKWYISQHACPSEVVQTALLAAIQAEEHEARERFRFDGVSVYAPHLNVKDLVPLAAASLDVRES